MSKEIALTLDSRKRLGSTYLKLTKPKVVALMLVTAIVGMSLAPVTDFPWIQASIGLIGIGLMAGSAAAFNHLIDRRIDARMARTHRVLYRREIPIPCRLRFLPWQSAWLVLYSYMLG